MKKLLIYLWQGIFILISILSTPLMFEYAKQAYIQSGKSIVNICFCTIYLLILLGLICVIGYCFQRALNLLKDKK